MIDTIDIRHSTNMVQRACLVCSNTYASAMPQAKYCSPKCKRTVLLRKRHERGRQRRYRRCPRCEHVFIASRADGVYCSNACRQAMHRWRHHAEGPT